MAKDIQLNQLTWDSVTEFNDLLLIDDEKEVNQSVTIRLRTILTEWFDDNRLGVPWLTDMSNIQIPMQVKKHIIRVIIRETYGIKSVESIKIDVVNSVAQVRFEATLKDGSFFDNIIEIDRLNRNEQDNQGRI